MKWYPAIKGDTDISAIERQVSATPQAWSAQEPSNPSGWVDPPQALDLSALSLIVPRKRRKRR